MWHNSWKLYVCGCYTENFWYELKFDRTLKSITSQFVSDFWLLVGLPVNTITHTFKLWMKIKFLNEVGDGIYKKKNNKVFSGLHWNKSLKQFPWIFFCRNTNIIWNTGLVLIFYSKFLNIYVSVWITQVIRCSTNKISLCTKLTAKSFFKNRIICKIGIRISTGTDESEGRFNQSK